MKYISVQLGKNFNYGLLNYNFKPNLKFKRIFEACKINKILCFCFINLSQQLSLREYGVPSRRNSAEQQYLRDLHVLPRRGDVLLGKVSASQNRM